MATRDVAEDLHMMQLSDSFFPTGMFAASNGLETLFAEKKISSAAELLDLTRVVMRQSLGPTDCVLLANAHRCAAASDRDKIREIDEMCCSARTNREAREASARAGGQLTGCVGKFVDDDETLNWYAKSLHDGLVPGMYPASFGVCCGALSIGRERALAMFLYGFAVCNVGAALRLGMIHHFDGQRIIHQLKPDIGQTVRESLDAPLSDAWQFVPQLEIFQMHHERMDSRMFIT